VREKKGIKMNLNVMAMLANIENKENLKSESDVEYYRGVMNLVKSWLTSKSDSSFKILVYAQVANNYISNY